MTKVMVDTVVIKIRKYDYLDGVSAPVWNLNKKHAPYYEKHVLKIPKRIKDNGIYYPRVAKIRRGKDRFLRFEFSVPKLIYGNNVDEISVKDERKIVSTFMRRVRDLGVVVKRDIVKKAQLSTIHPSKNILLKDGYSASGVLQELKKIGIPKRFDFTQQKFINGGESIQCYSKNHSFVLYDKVKDLKKDKARAVDKDHNRDQKGLFDALNESKEAQILRLEVRIPNRSRLKKLLRKFNIDDKKTHFSDLFTKDYCKKFVKDYWNTMVADSNLYLFNLDENPNKIARKILEENDIQVSEAMSITGLYMMCKQNGVTSTRDMIEKNSSRRTWYRHDKKLDLIRDVTDSSRCHGWVSQIENQIDAFNPIYLKDLNISGYG